MARFWDELVPRLAEHRGDWSRIQERALALEAHFGVEGLYRLERVLERYAWLLRGATEPHRFGEREPSLPVMANYHYHMLLHEVIVDGRDAYRAMLAEPGRIVARHERSTAATQLWALGILRYDQVMVHILCFRAHDIGIKGMKGLPSFLEYHDFLFDLVPPQEEFQLKIMKHDHGEYTIDGFYPPPPLALDRATAVEDSTSLSR